MYGSYRGYFIKKPTFIQTLLLKIIVFCIYFEGMSQICLADLLTVPELHFSLGYHSFLNLNYSDCADHFYQALNLQNTLRNRARLYLSYCQTKLHLKSFAAYQFMEVQPDTLSRIERILFYQLKRELNTELYELNKATATFAPYYGLMDFSVGSPKVSGQYFGFSGEVGTKNWKISLGSENLTITMRSPLSDYSQIMGLIGLSATLLSSWEIHSRFAYIYSALQSQSGIRVFDIGTSLLILKLTKLYLDGYYSNYPNSSLGNMEIIQGSFSIEQWLIDLRHFDFWMKLGSHTIIPSAPATIDPSTGFTIKNRYQRFSLDINTRIINFQLGATGWIGSEAFGIRNDAAIIFSGLEEHHFGWGFNTSYMFSKAFRMSFAYSNEYYNINSIGIHSNSAYGMLTLGF